MHSYHTLFGVLSALIALVSYIPYFRSILKGESKPSRATFGTWSFIGIVETASYAASGARATVWLPIVYAIGDISVFILSFKRGMGGKQPLDILCLLGAVAGIVCWAITKDPRLALYLSMSASACGFIPTLRKVYVLPQSENRTTWAMDIAAAACNLVAVAHLNSYLVLYPLYTLVFDSGVVGLMMMPRRVQHSTTVRPTRRARQRVRPALQRA